MSDTTSVAADAAASKSLALRAFAVLKTVLGALLTPVTWLWGRATAAIKARWATVKTPTAGDLEDAFSSAGGELVTAARQNVAAVRTWTGWQISVLVLLILAAWGGGWATTHMRHAKLWRSQQAQLVTMAGERDRAKLDAAAAQANIQAAQKRAQEAEAALKLYQVARPHGAAPAPVSGPAKGTPVKKVRKAVKSAAAPGGWLADLFGG